MPEPLIDALRRVPTFADLLPDELNWLAEHMTDESLEAGQIVARAGDPAETMNVLLEGELRFNPTGAGSPTFVAHAGQVTGMLPYSRLTHYQGTGYAITHIRAARLHKNLFPEMLERIPVLGARLVATMADRIRETTRELQNREKLMALGKFSAGLAHELNNPASAARHSATALRDCLQELGRANHTLTQLGLSSRQAACLNEIETEAKERLASTAQLDSLERSDREEEISQWLERHGVEGAWNVSPALIDAGFVVDELDEIAGCFQLDFLSPVLTRMGLTLAIERLIQSIEHSTDQITTLVQSVKAYTYMDQAPEQFIDIHQGIEQTLTMLSHCLHNIQIIKKYDPQIPKVGAIGSELNQVWTNLIDNAIDAMNGTGTLEIRTARELDSALVEIRDSGPGIPEDVKSHIFEPFFTTKEVGSGTGLGLDVVYRIVQKHRGNVRFDSKPGETVFQVRLPLAKTEGEVAGSSASEPSRPL